MIWSRLRQANRLRSLLREYYPAALVAFGADLAGRDALAVLATAPSPERAGRLSQARIESLLRKAGRQRNVAATAARDPDRADFRAVARPARRRAGLRGESRSALAAVITTMVTQTEVLAGQVEQGFGQHPDVEIYRSQPGLGTILGARVLAEFGDDPDRYADARPEELLRHVTRSPKPPAPNGSSWPATPATGDSPTPSPTGLRRADRLPRRPAFYDRHRARGATHHQALRALANRLVGILHGCRANTTPSTTKAKPGTSERRNSAQPLELASESYQSDELSRVCVARRATN